MKMPLSRYRTHPPPCPRGGWRTSLQRSQIPSHRGAACANEVLSSLHLRMNWIHRVLEAGLLGLLKHSSHPCRPEDWDDEEDGEWEAPIIDNPKCSVGCGKWEAHRSLIQHDISKSSHVEAPKISNPNFKGKWYAPKIDNPAYIGEWKPRRRVSPWLVVHSSYA